MCRPLGNWKATGKSGRYWEAQKPRGKIRALGNIENAGSQEMNGKMGNRKKKKKRIQRMGIKFY